MMYGTTPSTFHVLVANVNELVLRQHAKTEFDENTTGHSEAMQLVTVGALRLRIVHRN